MLTPEESRVALRRLFRQRRVADLPLLLKTLRTDAPRSVFRRLSLVDYISSYNENGRYYTLNDIAEFDSHGLWQHQGVFFSKHGTLRATIARLVEMSNSGHTHGELEVVLRVRVHNMLLDLVKENRIGREPVGAVFLYVSVDRARAAAQLARRKELRDVAPQQRAILAGPPLVIEILLEIVRGARLVTNPADVAIRLQARGIEVTIDHVDAIFRQHGLKKTRAPRSRSSRR